MKSYWKFQHQGVNPSLILLNSENKASGIWGKGRSHPPTSLPFALPLVKCERKVGGGGGFELLMNITVAIFQSIINSLHYALTRCLELYLNQLEDEPCMVIIVQRTLPVIVVEYITIVMGCSMSSN